MVYVHQPQLRGLEHMCHGQAWGRNSNIFIHGTTQLEVRLTPIEIVESERCNAWRGTWKQPTHNPTSCDFASDIKLCYSAGAFDLAHSRKSLILRFLTAKSNSLWCIQGFLHGKAADVSIFNLFHYAFCESQQESWMNCMARPQLRWQSSLSAIEPTSKMDGLVWWMDELYEMWDSIFCFGTFWNQMVWWFEDVTIFCPLFSRWTAVQGFRRRAVVDLTTALETSSGTGVPVQLGQDP